MKGIIRRRHGFGARQISWESIWSDELKERTMCSVCWKKEERRIGRTWPCIKAFVRNFPTIARPEKIREMTKDLTTVGFLSG
jgi:hypothetical protein